MHSSGIPAWISHCRSVFALRDPVLWRQDDALGACFDLRKCYWEEPAELRREYPGLDPDACGPDDLAACRPCFEANMRKAAKQRKGWWGGWQPDKGACDAMRRVTDAWRATEKEARAALAAG